MTTNTAAPLPPTRVDPRQVMNYLKKVVNYNDAGIASGVAFENSIPKNAFIAQILVEIITAFNAVTTNVLTVGQNSTDYNDMVAAGDVDETATGVTTINRGLGRALTSAGDITPYAKYTQTGTAATAGKAEILIVYSGGEDIDGF